MIVTQSLLCDSDGDGLSDVYIDRKKTRVATGVKCTVLGPVRIKGRLSRSTHQNKSAYLDDMHLMFLWLGKFERRSLFQEVQSPGV